jgi:hypothetical protein
MIGGGTEKFHTILPVSITSVDVDLNSVQGAVTPGGSVILCVYDGGCDPPTEIIDEDVDGFWAMDYGDTLDIQPGFGMDATEFDEDGDGTSYEYWVPWYVLQAYVEWADSGIYLNAGDTITIQAYGEATTADLIVSPGSISGPDGQDGTCPGPGNMADCALNDAPYGALVGKIGEDGSPFLIGSHLTLEVEFSGDLYLAVNDNLGFYEDNEGEYLIYIVDWWIPEPNVWREDFEGFLAGVWSWVNENPELWNLTEQPGSLRIYASQYPTGGENLLLRPVPEGDFIIETHLLFEPDTNFQFAGVVIFQDESNFLQLGRAFCDIAGPCVGNGIYFDHAQDGVGIGGNFATISDPPYEVYLRLERIGDMVTGFYSPDGGTWSEIGTHWLPPGFQINGIGLTASQDFFTEEWDIPADFDYFELTEY